MEQRKSLRRKVSSFFNPQQSLSTVSEVEEGTREEEHKEEVLQQANMLSDSTPSRPSRLRRLSSFLPSISTQSKLQKDVLRKVVPRKQLPAQFEAPPTSAPARLPPAVPNMISESSNIPVAAPPNRLHKSNGRPLSEDEFLRAAETAIPTTNGMLLSPQVVQSENVHGRVASGPANSSPVSYHSEGEGGHTAISKLRRKSWMPGGKSRSKTASQEERENLYSAWINAGKYKIDYNIHGLLSGEKVPELWDESADTYVYLSPRGREHGPSFKVHSLVVLSSRQLMEVLVGDNVYGEAQGNGFNGRESMSAKSLEEVTRNLAVQSVASPPYTPTTSFSEGQSIYDSSVGSIKSSGGLGSGEKHLYFPMHEMTRSQQRSPRQGDIQSTIDVRNLFAFFTGQPLVATHTYPSQFHIFCSIAAMLKKFEYTNFDGTSYGECAQNSFLFYLEEQQLANVRNSREATLEGLILGEAMKCAELYNEAFTHAAGKWNAIQEIKSPLFNQLSTVTRARLDNASRQLKARLQTVNLRLENFEFPSLFAGIASSTSLEESKAINFKNCKSDYEKLRKAVRSYYIDLHGQWPPKAKSKKNDFNESGLNRLVLKCLYDDFASLYDYLVDRKSLTTRASSTSLDLGATNGSASVAVLRKLLAEFDASTPPVQPPIPFDVPLIPTIASIEPNYAQLSPTDQVKADTRKLKSHEATLILTKSHNLDAEVGKKFMDMFQEFETKEAQGKNVQELAEQRIGYWIFLYAVIQSLPLLIVDAPGLHFTKHVEYFLCKPPLGPSPWIDEAARGVQMSLYEVKGTGGYSLLPDDMVNHGVEAIFRRSHCWQLAEMWVGSDTETPQTQQSGPPLSPLSPPPVFGSFSGDGMGIRASSRPLSRSPANGQHSESSSPTPQPRSRTNSRHHRQSKRQSIALGLEKCDRDFGEDLYTSSGGSRPTSRGGSPMIGPGGRRNSSIPSGGGMDSRPESATTNTGMTFDDILSDIPGQAGGKNGGDKKGKKK